MTPKEPVKVDTCPSVGVDGLETTSTNGGKADWHHAKSKLHHSDNIDIQIGPDLNISRSPFDKKEYRQIMLPNGLRVVLICDVVAMHQNVGGIYADDDDEDDDISSSDDGEGEGEERKQTNSASPSATGDDESNDGSDDEDGDTGGLRQAAAAMVVGVGTMYDPVECQGLAHFMEHLLFMGSEKYPEENAYDSYLSKHGGSDNAFTELEYT